MKQTLTLPKSKNSLRGFLLLIFLSLIFIMNIKAQSPCTLPAFPAPAEIVTNAPEAAGYNLAYKLAIPQADQHWASPSDIPYSVNNAAALASTPYTRIAYYMKLQSSFFGSQWVWVSMDAFTNDISLIGIPTGPTIWQQVVHHMNIANYTGENKTGIDGNVEFWSNCYNAANSNGVPGASDDNFDFGDSPTEGQNCYGSFQVHDFSAMQTLFAYNGWAFSGSCDDLGIGSWSGGNADWTLTANACYYDVSELYVFVNAGSAPPSCRNATIYLDASGNASLTPDMISNAVAGSCGIFSVSISKNTFSCADQGNNSVTVTITDVNNNSTHCTANVLVKDTLAPAITATGSTLNLGCNPSAAAIQAALGTATVADNCAGDATLTSADGTVVANGCAYMQVRTWNATDASGNVAAAVSRTITWTVDITPPVITATGSALSLGCSPSASIIDAALGTAIATDNCGLATLTFTTSAVTTSGINSSQTRTWTASDACNNISTVSRTATWISDVTAPVITATGSTLSLGCSPSAAAIEAALGTATATDNSGSATLTSTTGAVTTSGNSISQTRTWTAKDVCNNSSIASRTVTWLSSCNHFFAGTVTCSQFTSGATALSSICYKNLLNIVSSVSPTSFYYYTTVTAPASLSANGSFCVDVTQTKSVSGFKFYSILKITASGGNCNVVATGSEVSAGQGRVTITGATPGASYIIGVNYNANSLVGSTFPLLSAAPTCQNNFASIISNTGSAFASGVAAAGSQGSLSASANCPGSGGISITIQLRPDAAIQPLSVAAEPNPSATDFNLSIKSSTNAPVSVRIFDVFGKLVQETGKISANTVLKTGSAWTSGTYFVEVVQGNERKIIKIIKTN